MILSHSVSMLYRSVIFTNAPLLKGYKYRDKFQIVPKFYFPNAPFCKYANHFPAFIEYEAEEIIEHTSVEQILRKKGFDDSLLEFCAKLPNQVRVRKEILLLLTCLTNFHFFEYPNHGNSWGIPVPLSEEELDKINSPTSQWIINCYTYPSYNEDIRISTFTQCNKYYNTTEDTLTYFTQNPNIENNYEIKFAIGTDFCMDRYFQMDEDLRVKVRRCIGLLADGIDLFDTKISLSLISIISCIEGMALIDYDMYGKTPKLSPTNRFTRYLKRYISNKSEEKYRTYYKKRCDIAHEGFLMTGDVDIYAKEKEQEQDYRMRLEILQAARMSLYCWLSREM